MVKLKIVSINFASFLVSIIPIFAIVGIFYLILPLETVWNMLGGVAIIYSIIAFIVYVFWSIYALKELNYEGEIVRDKIKNYDEETRYYVDFLTEQGFKYAGIIKNKRTFKKPGYSLIFVHSSRMIHAQIAHFNEPDENQNLQFSTFWDGTHFVATVQDSNANAQLEIIQRDDKHVMSLVDKSFIEVYDLHKSNVKEFHSSLGKPQVLSSLQQIVEWESQAIYTAVVDTLYASLKLLPRLAISTGMTVLFITVLITLALVFPSSDELSTMRVLSAFVLAFVMGFAAIRIMPNVKSKEKSKNNSLDAEVNDLLSDMDLA